MFKEQVKQNKIKVNSTGSAFTLIELLLVVGIIGILAGVMTTVINPTRQRLTAMDGVARSNLEKMVQSIESYCSAEASCPTTANYSDANSVLRKSYILAIPTDTPISYYYSAATSQYVLYVNKPSNTAKCLKYYSGNGIIQECAVASCPTSFNTTCN